MIDNGLNFTILYSDMKKDSYIYKNIINFLNKRGIGFVDLRKKFSLGKVGDKEILCNSFIFSISNKNDLVEILENTGATVYGSDYWKTSEINYIIKL